MTSHGPYLPNVPSLVRCAAEDTRSRMMHVAVKTKKKEKETEHILVLGGVVSFYCNALCRPYRAMESVLPVLFNCSNPTEPQRCKRQLT